MQHFTLQETSAVQQSMPRNKVLLELSTYALTVFLCISILVWVARLWEADLSVPLAFQGDLLFYHALIKGIIENGWVLHNNSIGMPTGFDLYDMPMADNLHFALIKLISYFVPNSAVTLNLFAILTFPLITITSLFVFRSLNLSRPSSIAAGLLYTFLPYHFMRLGGHTFLAAYYQVPLATLLILWAFSREPIFFRFDETNKRTRLSLLNHRALISMGVCLVIASTSTYYAFFACFFLLIAAIYHLLSRHKRYTTYTAAILILLISSGVLINLLPNLYYKVTHGPNKEAGVRFRGEAEIYGLKVAQLLLPAEYHRVPFLQKTKIRYGNRTPLSNENTTATLGMIGNLGFLILLARLFGYRRGASGTHLALLAKLSMLNLSAVLLATIGGFSSLFAHFITPQIRGYNRISVYIGLFSLMAFFVCYEAFCRRFLRGKMAYLSYPLIAFILALGILDQTPSFYPTGMIDRTFKENYEQEADFIRGIEAAVPSNAMVFQLPYVPCPENPPVNRMKDYDHFRAYLHSKSLRWSYGAIKGRMTDGWQKTIAAKPVQEFVAILSLSGFNGIYVDRFGYPDMGVDLERELSKIMTVKPLVSPNKRLGFFNMSEFNKKAVEERASLLATPLLPVWGEGFSDLEDTPRGNSRACSSEGRLYIFNLSSSEERVTLEMTLATGRDKSSNLRIESPVYSETLKINQNDTFFSHKVIIPPGVIAVRFKCDVRSLRVMNFRIKEQ
jgi:phosphoglycerol transferase